MPEDAGIQKCSKFWVPARASYRQLASLMNELDKEGYFTEMAKRYPGK